MRFRRRWSGAKSSRQASRDATSSSSSSRTRRKSPQSLRSAWRARRARAATSSSQAARHPSRHTRKLRSASPTGARQRSGLGTSAASRRTTSIRTSAWRNVRCSTGSRLLRRPCTGSRASWERTKPPPTTSESSETRRSICSCSASARTATSPRCSRTRRRFDRAKRVLPAEAGLEPFVDRVTMSLPTLNSARRDPLRRLGRVEGGCGEAARSPRKPSPETPASLVRATDGRTIAILDRAAAAALPA